MLARDFRTTHYIVNSRLIWLQKYKQFLLYDDNISIYFFYKKHINAQLKRRYWNWRIYRYSKQFLIKQDASTTYCSFFMCRVIRLYIKKPAYAGICFFTWSCEKAFKDISANITSKIFFIGKFYIVITKIGKRLMAKDFFRNKTEFNFQLSIIDFHRLKSKTSGCRLG